MSFAILNNHFHSCSNPIIMYNNDRLNQAKLVATNIWNPSPPSDHSFVYLHVKGSRQCPDSARHPTRDQETESAATSFATFAFSMVPLHTKSLEAAISSSMVSTDSKIEQETASLQGRDCFE